MSVFTPTLKNLSQSISSRSDWKKVTDFLEEYPAAVIAKASKFPLSILFCISCIFIASSKRCLKGELSNNDLGFLTNIPPELIVNSHWRLLLSMVAVSVR